ncbi:MAG: hypothetical protein AAFQ09_01785 [Pseudomonadota bacterium]
MTTFLAGCQINQLTDAEKRTLNLEFDKAERAYGPKPVDLRGKNVLYFAFRNEFSPNEYFYCRDACRFLVDGNSGATMFYGVTDFPETPDYSNPLDLRGLVMGRMTAGPDVYTTNLRPRGQGQPAPRIDYVLIDQKQGITPVLNQIMPAYGLRPEDADVWEVFARVDDHRRFQLAPSNAIYINFGRDTRLQNHNSYHGTYYNPYTQIDRDEVTAQLQKMFCDSSRNATCSY